MTSSENLKIDFKFNLKYNFLKNFDIINCITISEFLGNARRNESTKSRTSWTSGSHGSTQLHLKS